MTGTLVVAGRELSGLFKAPFTWIVIVVVLLLNGWLFNYALMLAGGNVSLALSTTNGGILFWVWMVFLPALLAMRLVSEESRSGTLEYLLTAPVSDMAVVVGKFIAATSFLGILWMSTLLYAAAVDSVGATPDWTAVIGTWFGTILVTAMFVAIGMFASTFTSTPLLAAFLSMVACVSWLLVPLYVPVAASHVVPLLVDAPASREAMMDKVQAVAANMDAYSHFQRSFSLGIFDTAEAVFFLTWTALFLFLTARSIEARRWRG